MSQYELDLNPDLINRNTEGSLDSSKINGQSIQRSAYLDVYNGTSRKVVEVDDGSSFTNTIASLADNANIVTPLPYRIVDNSGDGLDKVVWLYLVNVAADFSEEQIFWKAIPVSAGGTARFKFLGDNVISGTLNGVQLTPIVAVTGKKYGISGSKFVRTGDADSGSEVKVVNTDSTYDLKLEIKRNDNVFIRSTVAAGDDYSFQILLRFHIAATTGAEPAFEEVNTEIAVIGVASSDVVITSTEEVYVFSLSNIVGS